MTVPNAPSNLGKEPPPKSGLTVPVPCRFTFGTTDIPHPQEPGKTMKVAVVIVESANGTFHFFTELDYLDTIAASAQRTKTIGTTNLYVPPAASMSSQVASEIPADLAPAGDRG